KEILTKLKTKERYTLEDAIFVYHATKNNLETFYLKDGKLVSVGVEKFKGLYNSLNEYCSDIIEEPLGYETPYVSMGLFGAIAHSVGVDPEESSKVLEYNLQEITGKEIKVPEKDLIYPKTYFGVWLGLLAGIMAPALVKSLVMSYTKRKKREKLDDNIGFVNLIIGNAGVDIIHPYIFWGRLFLPVLTEIMVSKTKENVNKE
ncbi:hypothetical protein HY837_03295, partial [archaeon]|nr:hypothetical protein [archaeon]